VAEFERSVNPIAAKLAVGFTSHYQWAPGEAHVGGIRGPLRSHILIREALVRVSEPERLEVLVHELGHYVGAAHSASGTSVMRPMFGDRRSCARGFRIGFDAQNALAMNLVVEQLRGRSITSLAQCPADVKTSLRCVYTWLANSLPEDPAAWKYLILLNLPTD
jgi:hypothetical protein